MKKLLPILATALVGCSSLTTTTLQISEPLKPNTASEVKLLNGDLPTNSIFLGSVFATWEPSWWSWAYTPDTDAGAKSAQAILKTKAAAMGANGLKIVPWNTTPYVPSLGYTFDIAGDAYYIP
jgi:hypothetical protein